MGVASGAAEAALAADSTQGKKLVIDDIVIDIVDEDGLEFVLEKHNHALQDSSEVTDHATRRPIVFKVVGEIVSQPVATDEHKQKMRKLSDLNRKRERIDLVVDYPPRVLKGYLITSLIFGRAKPWIDPNFYTIEITCEESPVAQIGGSDDEAIVDPLSGMKIEGGTTNLGERQPMNWDGSSDAGASEQNSQVQSGKQEGGGGLLNFFKKGIEFIEDKTGLSVTDLAIDGAKALANTLLPGSGAAIDIAAEIARGDFSLSDIADIALDNIPGGGVVKDLLSGPVGDALSFVEKIPGAKSLLSKVTNPEAAAGSLLGAVAGEIGKNIPGMGDAAGLIKSVLNPAQAVNDVKNAIFNQAKEKGIPPALLKQAEKAVLGSG